MNKPHASLIKFKKRILNLPYRNKTQLELFLEEFEQVIHVFFPSQTSYSHDLKRIRFSPSSFYSKEEDYKISWEEGTRSVLKLIEQMALNLGVELPPDENLYKNIDLENIDSSLEKNIYSQDLLDPQNLNELFLHSAPTEPDLTVSPKEEESTILLPPFQPLSNGFIDLKNDIPNDKDQKEIFQFEHTDFTSENSSKDSYGQDLLISGNAPGEEPSFPKKHSDPMEQFILEVELSPDSQTINVDDILKPIVADSALSDENSFNDTKIPHKDQEDSHDLKKDIQPTEEIPPVTKENEDESLNLPRIKSIFKSLAGKHTFASKEVSPVNQETQNELSPTTENPPRKEVSKMEQLDQALERIQKTLNDNNSSLKVTPPEEDNFFQTPLMNSKINPNKESFNLPQTLHSVFVSSSPNLIIYEQVLHVLNIQGLSPVFFERKTDTASMVKRFEGELDFTFAIVILSGDDLAFNKDQDPQLARPRAQQQIIFELGFLIAKLGRANVFVLYQDQDQFELPTQFFELLYTPYSPTGGWQFDLLRQLKKCGFLVDANKLI